MDFVLPGLTQKPARYTCCPTLSRFFCKRRTQLCNSEQREGDWVESGSCPNVAVVAGTGGKPWSPGFYTGLCPMWKSPGKQQDF